MFPALDSMHGSVFCEIFARDRSRVKIALHAAHAEPVSLQLASAIEGAGVSLKKVKLHNLYEFVIV